MAKLCLQLLSFFVIIYGTFAIEGRLDWCHYWRLLNLDRSRPECVAMRMMSHPQLQSPIIVDSRSPSMFHLNTMHSYKVCEQLFNEQSGCANCQPSCATPFPICGGAAKCEVGCTCIPGFVRNEQNDCVPRSFCTKPASNLKSAIAPSSSSSSTPDCPSSESTGLDCNLLMKRTDVCETNTDCLMRYGPTPRVCCKTICGNKVCSRLL